MEAEVAADEPTREPEKLPDVVPERRVGGDLAAKAAGFVTLLIKLGGLAIAGHEALLSTPPRDPLVFGVAAFMMAGAQGLDNLIDNFLGRKK